MFNAFHMQVLVISEEKKDIGPFRLARAQEHEKGE